MSDHDKDDNQNTFDYRFVSGTADGDEIDGRTRTRSSSAMTATTGCSATPATILSAAVTATITCSDGPAKIFSRAEMAMTSSTAERMTTGFTEKTATTGCQATKATMTSPAGTAPMSCRAAMETTYSTAERTRISSSAMTEAAPSTAVPATTRRITFGAETETNCSRSPSTAATNGSRTSRPGKTHSTSWRWDLPTSKICLRAQATSAATRRSATATTTKSWWWGWPPQTSRPTTSCSDRQSTASA